MMKQKEKIQDGSVPLAVSKPKAFPALLKEGIMKIPRVRKRKLARLKEQRAAEMCRLKEELKRVLEAAVSQKMKEAHSDGLYEPGIFGSKLRSYDDFLYCSDKVIHLASKSAFFSISRPQEVSLSGRFVGYQHTLYQAHLDGTVERVHTDVGVGEEGHSFALVGKRGLEIGINDGERFVSLPEAKALPSTYVFDPFRLP